MRRPASWARRCCSSTPCPRAVVGARPAGGGEPGAVARQPGGCGARRGSRVAAHPGDRRRRSRSRWAPRPAWRRRPRRRSTAGRSGDIGLVAAATELADLVMADAERLVRARRAAARGGRRARRRSCISRWPRAHRARMRGRPSPAAWDRLATAWTARQHPVSRRPSAAGGRCSRCSTATVRARRRARRWRTPGAWPPRCPRDRCCGRSSDFAVRARLPLPDEPARVAELVSLPAGVPAAARDGSRAAGRCGDAAAGSWPSRWSGRRCVGAAPGRRPGRPRVAVLRDAPPRPTASPTPSRCGSTWTARAPRRWA